MSVADPAQQSHELPPGFEGVEFELSPEGVRELATLALSTYTEAMDTYISSTDPSYVELVEQRRLKFLAARSIAAFLDRAAPIVSGEPWALNLEKAYQNSPLAPSEVMELPEPLAQLTRLAPPNPR